MVEEEVNSGTGMRQSEPLVSIGMPVYNGEPFIRQALDSLLAQDYEHFELIISDNASTDRTQEICLEYAACDRRIRYYRNSENLGALANFNRVLALAKGEYFMWAAHDDLWSPNYVSICARALSASPQAVLCTTSAYIMDALGNVIARYEEDIDSLDLTRVERLRKVIANIARNTSFYGLFRRAILERVAFHAFYGSDHVFLAEASLYGDFVRVPQSLFYSRVGGAGNSPQGVLDALRINSFWIRFLPNLSFLACYLWAAANWRGLGLCERLLACALVMKRFISPPYPGRVYQDIRHSMLHTYRYSRRRLRDGCAALGIERKQG
jgi:glycosyltransferase involved in cell wall biosynthesis